MLILLDVLVFACVAAAAFAAAVLARRTTIHFIIRKDPDMATIHQRLSELEADRDALKAQLAAMTDTGAEVATLTDRVNTIEADLGTDAAAAPIATDSVAEPTMVDTSARPEQPVVS